VKPWIAGIAALVSLGIGIASLITCIGGVGISFFHDSYFVSFESPLVVAVLSLGASSLLLTLAVRSAKG
jgi:hypothetical protein